MRTRNDKASTLIVGCFSTKLAMTPEKKSMKATAMV